MAWVCMAAIGTVSLVFVDDVTADKSIRMNSEGYGLYFLLSQMILQLDNDPKVLPKVFSMQRNGIFFIGQVSHSISTY